MSRPRSRYVRLVDLISVRRHARSADDREHVNGIEFHYSTDGGLHERDGPLAQYMGISSDRLVDAVIRHPTRCGGRV